MKKGIFTILVCLAAFSFAEAQKTVGLDNWYNRETNSKTSEPYHYIWTDTAFSGFSQLGELFRQKGATLQTIGAKPNQANLNNVDIYIIVDPDTPKESANPNYIGKNEILLLKKWVKNGGVLLLMANDGPNCEFEHFNQLAGIFGFHFNPVTLNPVVNRVWEMGAEMNLPNHPLFDGVSKIYLKEVASIALSGKATPVLTDGHDHFIAETRFGKGYVMAIGDPWLYNEYIDHALLPESFENLKAANNLVELLLNKTN